MVIEKHQDELLITCSFLLSSLNGRVMQVEFKFYA